MRVPVIELSDCIHCGVCVEVCPNVFSETDAGYIQVTDLDEYPEEEVDEAIRNCPTDCIAWEDQKTCSR